MTKAIESQAHFLIDFGCAECDFLFYVSRRPEKLLFGIGVDKDDFVLKKAQRTFSGGSISYARSRPFQVALLKEDITSLSDEFVEKYQHCPFVTALELIEHLDPEDVSKAVKEIFGRLKPKCVYLTTPNIEYNDLLTESFGRDRRHGKFRHLDHKFEWTRAEFAEWCNSIAKAYPYTCDVGGVGRIVDGDDGTKGFASHAVFFTRTESVDREFDLPENPVYLTVVDVDAEENYVPGFTPKATPEHSQYSTEVSEYNSPMPDTDDTQ